MSYQLPSAFLQKFTPREIHEAKRAFKAHDRDSAAAVDAAELHTVLQTLGENVTPGQAAVMLRQVALERAGVVSWPEFLHLLYDFRNGAIALDPAALVAAVDISTPVEAAPVAPVAAPEPTPLFPKKASNWPPQEHEQPPAQPAAFAHKAQWPPAGAAPAENAPTTHKAQWPPAGAAATQTATWAKQPASPVKEAPAASTPKAQWPPASPTKGAATSPAKAQWPPASPTKGAASAGGKWPPTRDQRSPSAAKQWPPAREQRSVSTPKQWPPTAQTASVPAAPTAAVPSAPPQWGASAGGAAPGWGDSAKTQWPPAASSSAPTAEKSPVAAHKPQWPPVSSSTAEKSPSSQKRVQWPPAGAATSESPSSLPPRSPPRSPVRSPAKTLIAEENSPSAKLDAHAMSVLQRRASAAATFNANVTIHEVRGTAGGLHSYSQEETVAFTQHINNCLQSDRALASLVPIRTDSGLFTAVRDGVLLCKLINAAVPETIDERAVNLNKREKDMNVYQKTENLNLCINAAKSIGCSVVNIGPDDLLEGKPILVLGLVWQIIKIQLTSTINLKNHPELMRLLLEGETLEEFMKLPPDQILLRWMNYHLKAAGHPKTVTNFSKDLQDAVAYSVLLHHIAPEHCDLCHETVPEDRAAHVIQNARKLGIETFIKPRDITSGNPKLNMSFVAQLFNTCPALDIVEEEMKQLEEILYDDVGDTREERVFRMWINSLAIDEVYINHLFSDLHDGLNILKVLDKIEKGIVSWQKVNLVAPNKFKQVENCNYCVVLGKQLKFSLVNIGGADIYEGAKKMILSIIWQSMRYQQLKLLSSLAKGGQGEITDKDIIDWANAKVRQHGRIQTQIVAFRDPALADALYLLDLVHAVEPRAVNWELIARDAQSDEDKASNAKYAISCAQKIGAAVFLTYEDIVEVKSKMIMTFVASLMAVDMHKLHV